MASFARLWVFKTRRKRSRGRGADRQYVGRNELDESTIDRFRMGTVPMDYAPKLERQLCPDDMLYRCLVSYRKRIIANRLEWIVSTRFIAQAYVKKHCHGWSDERIGPRSANYLGIFGPRRMSAIPSR